MNRRGRSVPPKDANSESNGAHCPLDYAFRFFQRLHDARGGKRLVSTPPAFIFQDRRLPPLLPKIYSEMPSDSTDNSTCRGAKRSAEAVKRLMELEKLKDDKRKRRQHRHDEGIRRQKALLLLQSEFRTAREAVQSGHFKLVCTPNSINLTVPTLRRSPFFMAIKQEAVQSITPSDPRSAAPAPLSLTVPVSTSSVAPVPSASVAVTTCPPPPVPPKLQSVAHSGPLTRTAAGSSKMRSKNKAQKKIYSSDDSTWSDGSEGPSEPKKRMIISDDDEKMEGQN